VIPILIWNIAFGGLLPAVFQGEEFNKDIPATIIWIENILRLAVFALPAFMPLTIFYRYQKFGLVLYFVGTFLYFLSWRPLLLYPEGVWSTSLIGYLAPAITPLIFLIGIGLIGYRLFFNIRYKQAIYIFLATLFVLVHITHVYLVYNAG
jgi:hypothetical protein